MNFLLDTNILIYCLQRRAGSVFQDFVLHLSEEGSCFVSVINRFEVLAGTLDIYRKKNLEFLDSFPLLSLTASIADRSAVLLQEYKKHGVTVDHEDLFLAATALEENLSIVTTNAKHFPSFRPVAQHRLSFRSRKGTNEIKVVFVLKAV